MDITRGSLDDISRPASSSRINHGSKVLSTSLEILTPAPSLPKVAFYNDHKEHESKENYDENREEYGTKKMRTSEVISEEKTNSSFQLVIQSTNQVKEYSSSSADSEDDWAENRRSCCSNASQNELARLAKVTVNSAYLQDSKEKDVDPRILKAIKKMERLDQILANKQSQERAIKKQGREMRTKLWEDFQSMTSRSSSVVTEEAENTSRFLALTTPSPEMPDSPAAEEDEMFVSVFDTQIHPENYGNNSRQTKQGDDRTRSSIKKMEKMTKKSETSSKKTDFVKKNIELAKDSVNQVVMPEEDKKRLSELLKDTEDESSELQVTKEEATTMLAPGEGYTPEPLEYHHLTEINAKLKLVISDGNLSADQNSCSIVSKQIYQPDVLPCLSEEQLNALLEECMQTPRRVNSLTLPESQGSFLERTSLCCNTAKDIIPSDDAQSVEKLANPEMMDAQDNDTCSKEMMETSDCNLSRALDESHLLEKKENENQESQEEEIVHASSSEDYFMSIALSTDNLKKPSFLDEPFYCISTNNEPSTDVNIPSIPLKTRGDEQQDEDMTEE
ncbi:fibrous sheath-interacting protein 1 isoform X3 [Zootoca vivipara]|uniref:fibrous sheath-interacting protein 1 isoform X3 n=1 Tax=Zootoca vivipara TaxID=8524 RepID=UPI00293C10DC|nr:fibrous sheath-interacting protein 1 isoform X3 [Zootoca vivipara]